MLNQKVIRKLILLIFFSIIFSKTEIRPIFKYLYLANGGDLVIQKKSINSVGLGFEILYKNDNFRVLTNFSNNRFSGSKFKSKLFNANKGIGWANSHELKGEKFDYDIINVDFSYVKNQIALFFSTINPIVDISYSSILFSNKIPSMPHIGFKWKISKKTKYLYYHGRLKSGISYDFEIDLIGTRNTEIESYYVLHQLSYKPIDFIEFKFGESVVYGNRGIELSYAPFVPMWSMQHFLGDFDNIQWNLITIFKPKQNLKIYNVILIDEFRPGLVFKKNNRNWFAWQLGLKREKLINDDEIQFEFSWVDHRVYRHRFLINDYYSHGYPIGFWAGPHSQEFVISYSRTINNYQICFKYSDAARGEITDQMIVDQYATKYFERFSGIVEKRKLIDFALKKNIYKYFEISIGINYVAWQNAGFDPTMTENNSLENIEKRSFYLSISNFNN